MANIKIAQLTETTIPNDSDILILEDALATKKITLANLLANFAKKGAGVWTSLPSLLNGWAGALVYRKSDTGLVAVEVSVSNATVGSLSDIGVLPAGFKPPYEIAFRVVAPTTGHVADLYINSAGNVRTPQNNTLASGVAYSGVAFFVV